MTQLFSFILLGSLFWPWGFSLQTLIHEAGHQAQAYSAEAPSGDISVCAAILKQTYCNMDLDGPSIQMSINLRFVNLSDHSVILSRVFKSPAIVRVARTIDDAQKGNFEYNPRFDDSRRGLSKSPQFGKSPDPRYFIILAPKESYETTITSP